MSASRQRQLVLIGSLSSTMLLVGGVLGGLMMWRGLHAKMQDPEFLQTELDRLSPPSGQSETGPPPALVRVSVAQRKSIRPQRPIVGRLVEVRKVTVASEVTGEILELPVDEGTPVTDGKTVVAEVQMMLLGFPVVLGMPLTEGQTVLARVDDIWSRLARDRCEAQAASTKAKLDYEKLELKRARELTGTISESEIQSKQATVDELEASLRVCQRAAEEEKERFDRSTILAPFDGTVVVKHVELGGHVEPGDPIVDIVSRGQVDARLMVPESVINLVRLNQVLWIGIDPLGEDVQGTVVSVTPYGPAASRTFPVRVRLDDQGGRLKVGMSVTALVPTGPEREALVVSKDAVLVRPDGSTVWVATQADAGQGDMVQPVPVSISVRLPKEYAVEPGTEEGRRLLVAGSRVVVEGAERLAPGQRVRVVRLDGGPAALAGSGGSS